MPTSNDVGDYPVARAANAPPTETQNEYVIDPASQTLLKIVPHPLTGFATRRANDAESARVDVISPLAPSNQGDAGVYNQEVIPVPGSFVDKSLLGQYVVFKPSQAGTIYPSQVIGRTAQSLPNEHNRRPPVLARKKFRHG